MPGPEEKLVFVGRTPRALCEQVKDGKGNGGKDMKALREHLNTSLVTWGWGPGNGGTRLRRHMRPSWLRGNGGRPPVRLARPEGIAGAPRRATVRAASLGARAASGPRNDSLDACARCSARHRVHRDSRRSSIGAVARIEHSRHGHFARSIVPSNEPDETPVAGFSRRTMVRVPVARANRPVPPVIVATWVIRTRLPPNTACPASVAVIRSPSAAVKVMTPTLDAVARSTVRLATTV